MINCGGGIMIGNLFTTHVDTKVYIIDSHRPLLLDNLLDENNHICVFDDESDSSRMMTAISACEKAMAAEDEENSDEDNIDEDDEEEEDEDGRPINPRSKQRRRLNDILTPAERSARRLANRTIIDYYNQGAFFANSVSGSVYELAQQLGKTNNELLWLAIVGVTSQYIFERIDTMKYADQLEIFRDDRARLNVDRGEDGQTQSVNNTVIKSEDEYRFMMFRHWSLYDSMYHSGYVSSKLAVWKDAGKKRLNNMFAKMGFSLQQCQQVYTHMDMDLKQMLRNKIEVVAPLYGLTDICFPSFTRSYGWECCLSASDVVYALSTILETSPAAATRLGADIKHRHGNEDDWKPTHQTTDTSELKCGRKDWWMRNFFTAYDALKDSSPDIILHGLKLCMETQKAIVRQGTSVIDKRMVKLLKNFRFVNIRNTAELPMFQHPSSLTKLGLFLTDAYRVSIS
jgi:cell division control protein 45